MKIVIVLIICLYSLNVSSQWIQGNSICDADVNALYSYNNRIYAGTYLSGIFYSTNNGDYWNRGDLNMTVNCVTVHNNILFAGADHPTGSFTSGVYSSTNDGRNWILKGLQNFKVFSLSSKDNALYAGTDAGLMVSYNNGLSWGGLGGLTRSAYSLLRVENHFFVGSLGYIFHSSNSGYTFEMSGLPNSNCKAYALISLGNKIIAGTDYGILYSTNFGINWNMSQSFSGIVRALAAIHDTVFAGTSNMGIYYSSDCINWHPTSLYSQYVSSLLSSNNTLYAGFTKSGYYESSIYKSLDMGIQWQKTNLNNQKITSIIADTSRVLTSAVYTGTHESTNAGLTWHNFYSYTSSYFFKINCLGKMWNTYYAGSDTYGMFSSYAYGWILDSAGIGFKPVYAVASGENGIFAGVSQRGVYKKINKNDKWTQTSLNNIKVTSLAVKGNIVLAGATVGSKGLYFSSNNGNNWNSAPLIQEQVYSIILSGDTIFVGTNNGIYKSNNLGISWIQSGLESKLILSLAHIGNNVFAGTLYDGLYMSTDYGNNWKQKNQGFVETTSVTALCIANGYIYAGTDGQSFWRRSLQEITNVEFPYTPLPVNFSFSLNYPNPFNPITTLKFEIPRKAFVQLTIFDITGKESETIVNEMVYPGNYEIKWNGSKFSSGLYFCRLLIDGRTFAVRKMILAK